MQIESSIRSQLVAQVDFVKCLFALVMIVCQSVGSVATDTESRVVQIQSSDGVIKD